MLSVPDPPPSELLLRRSMNCGAELSRTASLPCLSPGSVCFWDLAEETLVKRIAAHSGVVCSLAVHPDMDCLLTASTDGAVSVWR